MVDMLASNDWCNGVALLRGTLNAAILKLQTLLLKTGLDGIWIAVHMLAMLDGDHVVGVLLRQNLAVLDRLHRSVVVVLVHLTIDGSRSLFMTVLADLLIHDCRSDLLMDSGVMMTRLRPVKLEVSHVLQTLLFLQATESYGHADPMLAGKSRLVNDQETGVRSVGWEYWVRT